jgi:hypothetical protein
VILTSVPMTLQPERVPLR